MSVQDPFTRLIVAIEPWLDQIVIVGGWAFQLYRRHPAAQEVDYPLLTTEDADIAVPLKLPARAESLRKRLLTHGFTEEFFGEDRPPATHYHLGDEASGFYAQFLAPLMGSEHDRKGRSKSTIEVGGVTSERLRHIELLLHDPWTVEFESGGIAATIQIANPVCFLAQKVLIHQKRARTAPGLTSACRFDTKSPVVATFHITRQVIN